MNLSKMNGFYKGKIAMNSSKKAWKLAFIDELYAVLLKYSSIGREKMIINIKTWKSGFNRIKQQFVNDIC